MENEPDQGWLGIEAVVVPATSGEVDAILQNFELWANDGFAPSDGEQVRQPQLLIIFNNERAKPSEGRLISAYRKRNLGAHFSDLQIRYLDLHGMDDLYTSDYTADVGKGGYKAGPNNQFFGAMQVCASMTGFIFYMETDCIPIRANWLEVLHDTVRRNSDALVIGSIYRGGDRLHAEIERHINGNAIYNVGAPEFGALISDWRRWLDRLLSEDMLTVAYDFVIEIAFSRASSDADARAFLRAYAHALRPSHFIQNISAPYDEFHTPPDIVCTILNEEPRTALVHGRIFATAAADLLHSGQTPRPELLRVRQVPEPVALTRHRTRSLAALKSATIETIRSGANWLEKTNIKAKVHKLRK